MKKFIFLFSILFCLFFAFKVSAQLEGNDLSLILDPQYPGINTSVTASLTSYVVDLNKTYVSWILNGKTVFVGVGKKEYSFVTDNTGSPITIEASIETANGVIATKDITITPTGVDMLWEAPDSYVPPFYKGKALLVGEAVAKVVAIPTGGDIGGIAYTWKQDDTNQPDSSGYGKNSYIFKNTYLERENTVAVTLSSLITGSNLGAGTITLTHISPKINFYEKNPTLGIKWENALTDGFNINNNGETLVAEPYYFFPKNLSASDLNFTWLLNNSPINTPTPENELSVKPEAGTSGQATINLALENINTLFLNLSKTLNVNF